MHWQSLLDKNDAKGARVVLDKILRVDATNPMATLGLGMIHQGSSRFDEAHHFYKKASQNAPDNKQAEFQLRKFETEVLPRIRGQKQASNVQQEPPRKKKKRKKVKVSL